MPIVSNFPSGYGNMNTEIYDAQNRKQDIFDYADTVQENLGEHVSNQGNPHNVTAEQVGADPAGSAAAVQGNLDTHTSNHNNPHGVTAAQVGLGNVNNTSDADKPISTATQQALNTKADKVTPSATNNVALLSADGNLLDSGKQLTPVAIGAAPSGYGLGSYSRDLSGIDLNTVTQNGWYNITSITVNSPVTYGAMRVDNKDLTLVIQTIYSFDDNYNSVLRRFKTSSGWGSWKFTNTPLKNDVEYVTDNMWNGQPISEKIISLGTGSVGKVIQTGLNCTVISVDIFGWNVILPYFPSGSFSTDGSAYALVENASGGLQITLKGGSSGLTRELFALIKYVNWG